MQRLLPSLALAILCLCPPFCLEATTSPTGSPHIYSYETNMRNFLVPIPKIAPKSGMDGVDCLYVINLAKRPEKWQRIQQICRDYALFPTRVEAVNGTKLSRSILKTLCGRYPIRKKRGAIGCFLSHVSVFLDSYERKLNCVWICEDDIDFIENPHQMPDLLKKLTEIDPDWDVLYTDPDTRIPECYHWKETVLPNMQSDFRPDQVHLPMEYYLTKHVIDENFTRIGQRFGLYSYFVSKKGIQKLVHYFLHVFIWTEIDRDIHYVPDIREYALNKNVISHWVQSDTNDTQNP